MGETYSPASPADALSEFRPESNSTLLPESGDQPVGGPSKQQQQPPSVDETDDDRLDQEDFLADKEYGTDDESWSGSPEVHWTQEEERAIIKKFDRRLVLFMALLYLLSFLDRSNIGNARIAGMEDALHLSSNQYDWLLTAFYITYIVFEWMTLMYKIVPPHIYIATCVFAWGILASLQSVANSFGLMLAIRALLGVAEAAFGPGVPFYLSFFYKRSELAYRVGLFIAAAPLATSFASSLAWVIVRISRGGPLAPWRALFLVEGFPSIIVAFIAFYYIPDSPAHAKYLTPRQRRIAALRLQSDTTDSDPHPGLSSKTSLSQRISVREILQTLLDPPSYLTALMFLSSNVSFSSLPVFLPTIINAMGFTSLRSQILSAPPYLLSFFFVLLISRASDRLHTRSGLLVPVALLSAASYALIALAGAFHTRLGPHLTLLLRYIPVYGAAAGFFASITLIITWTLNNSHTHTGRGTGMAILNVVGQTGPLIGTRLYPEEDGPYYVKGMAVCAMFMVGVALLAVALRVVLARRNRRARRREGLKGLSSDGGMEAEEEEEMELQEGLMGDDDDRRRSRGGRRRDAGGQGREMFAYIL